MADFAEIDDVARRLFITEGGSLETWYATDEVERSYFRHRAGDILRVKESLERRFNEPDQGGV